MTVPSGALRATGIAGLDETAVEHVHLGRRGDQIGQFVGDPRKLLRDPQHLLGVLGAHRGQFSSRSELAETDDLGLGAGDGRRGDGPGEAYGYCAHGRTSRPNDAHKDPIGSLWPEGSIEIPVIATGKRSRVGAGINRRANLPVVKQVGTTVYLAPEPSGSGARCSLVAVGLVLAEPSTSSPLTAAVLFLPHCAGHSSP